MPPSASRISSTLARNVVRFNRYRVRYQKFGEGAEAEDEKNALEIELDVLQYAERFLFK
jgi:hypothetical protein